MCDPVKETKRTFKKVERAAKDAFDWVADEVLEPVFDTVGNVVQGMLDNPVKAIAQIAAITVSGGAYAWTLPLIEGADVAIKGGDVEDVLEATAKAYVAQQVGQAAGSYAYKSTVGSAYGAGAGQQAAQLAAQEVGMRTAADIAGQVIGAGAASTASGLIYGRDPVEALTMGLVSAGSSQLVGMALGELDKQTGGTFAKLRAESPTAASVIESAITAQVTGQDVTAAAISAAIRTSKVATQLVDQFAKDNPNISAEQKAIAAQILTNVTATAFAGGDPSRALQATLMQVGSKALGDVATDKFKSTVKDVRTAYEKSQEKGKLVDANIEKQKTVVAEYTAVQNQLKQKTDALEAERKIVNEYIDIANAAPDNAELANLAQKEIDKYNAAVASLNDEYAKVFKPKLDSINDRFSTIQAEYKDLVGSYEGSLDELKKPIAELQKEYDNLYFNTSRAFVQEMDPNFNENEYRAINKLGADVDVYEHWLSQGQFEGLKTNQKDLAVSEALNKYEQTFGKPPPDHLLGKFVDPTNQNRDNATKLFVDTAIKDKQRQDVYREEVSDILTQAYKDEGIGEPDPAEIDAFVNKTLADDKTRISQLQDYTKQVAKKYGTDSAEYKRAYVETLNTMADVGGYGVVKEGNDFVTTSGAKINSETLKSDLVYLGDNKGWLDPVTGQVHAPLRIDITGVGYYSDEVVKVETWGVGNPKEQEKTYNALFALGKSAKPPEQGGTSVFGDGSGSSDSGAGVWSKLFGGLTPIATDSGTGGTLYGGDNGFALIAYSDGRSAAINTKTMEVVLLTPEKTQEVLDKTPVAEPVKPVQANPTAPEPPKPPEIKPVDNVTTEIKNNIQSPAEVKSAFKSLGYEPTDQEVKDFAGKKSADELIEALKPYIDPRLVTDQEARDAYKALGIKDPTQEDIDKIKGQYAQTELTGKAESNLDAARYNSLTAGQKQLADQLIQQGTSVNAAIDTAKQQISDIASQIGSAGLKPTEEDAQKALQAAVGRIPYDRKYDWNGDGQITSSDALNLQKAARGMEPNVPMAEGLPWGKPSGLYGEIEGVRGDIAGVSADLQTKYDTLSAGQKTLADQLTQQGVDFNTAIDTAKATIAGDIAGVRGDIAGVQSALAAQQATATRQAQAALTQQRQMAQRATQQQNFNTLLQMLGQAQDVGGQQTTVKTPDPAKIGYVYDISGPSIFATPEQQRMFVTPYAQGGMVDDSDDVTAELLRILRS